MKQKAIIFKNKKSISEIKHNFKEPNIHILRVTEGEKDGQREKKKKKKEAPYFPGKTKL